MYLKKEEYFKDNESIVVTKSYFHPNAIVTHKHDFYELAYIMKGSGSHILNGVSRPISVGSTLFISMDSAHSYQSDGYMEWINILFLPHALDKEFIRSYNARDVLNVVLFSNIMKCDLKQTPDIEMGEMLSGNIRSIAEDMLREYEERQNGSEEILKGYLKVFLVKLFRAYYLQTGTLKPDHLDLNNVVLDYLDRHSLQQINIKELARSTFISQRYFHTLFKKQTGKSLISFIRDYKIMVACDLLRTTNLCVSDIMERIDMNDSKNFYSTFKSKTGITPRQYRLLLNAGQSVPQGKVIH